MTPGQSCTRTPAFFGRSWRTLKSTNKAQAVRPWRQPALGLTRWILQTGGRANPAASRPPTQRLVAVDWPRRTRQPRSNFRGTGRSLGRNAQVAEEGVYYRGAISVKIATDLRRPPYHTLSASILPTTSGTADPVFNRPFMRTPPVSASTASRPANKRPNSLPARPG